MAPPARRCKVRRGGSKSRLRVIGRVLDEQILTLYVRGMTTRDISTAIQEMYGAEVSPATVSQVTEGVYEQVITWQNRPLDTLIFHLSCF